MCDWFIDQRDTTALKRRVRTRTYTSASNGYSIRPILPKGVPLYAGRLSTLRCRPCPLLRVIEISTPSEAQGGGQYNRPVYPEVLRQGDFQSIRIEREEVHAEYGLEPPTC